MLFAGVAAQYWILAIPREYRKKHADEVAALDKKLYYLEAKGADLSNAKDARVYKIKDWFNALFKDIINQRLKWEKRFTGRDFIAGVQSGALKLTVDALIFAWLGYSVYAGKTSAADAILYFYAVQSFGGRLSGLTIRLAELTERNLSICYVREFMDMPDVSNRGKGTSLPDRVSISLENVGFTYEGCSEKTLDGLNLSLKAGEKLALVGRNGAGKTTAVKLICGFYQPTEGRVLINGADAAAFNYEEDFKLFSAVFQDIKLLPAPLAENVSGADIKNADMHKLRNCLELSDILDRAETLPAGINTPLVKGVDEISAELSGGEVQKLMLARALYKDAPVVILDEPSAALDPLAESELYLKYSGLTEGKTSIFISHRLASTRFCDKIAFIDGGRVLEYGTHAELMGKGGKYAEMFEIQSRYYQKEGIKKELETEGIL
jgi:ABC-type multidrug transport system fused ATPase/permease subunit